jgi:hypothetical protein
LRNLGHTLSLARRPSFNGDARSETKYKFDIVSIKLLRVSVEELLAFGFCFKLI